MVPPVTLTFSWYDYLIFCAMLLLSVLIGLYFGCFGTKQSTASEYLMGRRKMKVFPIVVSLVASEISAITLLGVPADVYRQGANFWISSFSIVVMVIVSIFIFIPVLFHAEITSIYEYLEKRFDSKTRILASFLFAISKLLLLPVVIYTPALAFAAATGINLHLVTLVTSGICIFYTSIGGLKAVVWTDNLQFAMMAGSMAAVLVIGVRATGGLGYIWAKSLQGNRLDIFDFDMDMTRSDTFFPPFIGPIFFWIYSNNTNQGCVQKLLSVATLRQAKLVTIFTAIGMIIVKTCCIFTGLIIYARYADCDPFLANQLKRNDQLLPYYVLDVAGHIPGLSGLFIAGVFSAGLSTLSANLNCLSGTIYEDFISKLVSKQITEKTKSYILKLIVVIFGATCTGLVFAFQHLGGITPLVIGFAGITAGPLLGMFTMGILCRRANSKGAFYGGIIGLVLIISLVMPTKYFQSQGWIRLARKPVSVEGCLNVTTHNHRNSSESGIPVIFKTSYYYYCMIGFFLTMIFGLIISYCTERDQKSVDEGLFSPIIRHRSNRKSQRPITRVTVEESLRLVAHNSEKHSST